MKTLYFFLALAMTAMSMQGCKEGFLERPPLDRMADANFYQTKAQVLAATGPLYNIVWFDFNDKAALAFGDARGGIMKSNDRAMWYRFNINSTETSTLLPAYKSFYKIIGQCNLVMQGIKRYGISLSSEDRAAGIAEAKFMRAMAYYYLTMNWGDVPVIYNNQEQMTDKNQRRNTQESVFRFIINDLRFAAQHLPPVPAKVGRVTKYTAEGELAKMYLTRAGLGKSNGTKTARSQSDLDSAKFFAGDVINNGPYSLLPNYADLFIGKNNNSAFNNSETLFALQWMPFASPYGVNNTFQAYMAFNSTITQSGGGFGGAHGASANMVKYYQQHPEDSVRRRQTFMFNRDYYPELNKKGGGTIAINTNVANVKKYIIGTPEENGGGANGSVYINTYMLRLAEVNLIYAEAILGDAASTSDADALKAFNAVRKRAGVPELSSISFMDIFMEKRIETAMEGTAWYDIRRWSFFALDEALDFYKTLNLGEYTLTYVNGTNPRRWTFVESTTKPEYVTPPKNALNLPIPETEMSFAPSLSLDPVPFDFSKLTD